MPPTKLTVWTADQFLPRWARGFPTPLIDLAGVRSVDPFGAAVLILAARRCAEAGGRARVLLPQRQDVQLRLAGLGVFDLLGAEVWLDRLPPPPAGEGGWGRLVRVEEAGISGLVDQVCQVLEERFPLGRRSINVLAMSMVELLQNIPHHANPLGEDVDPWGLAAVEEHSDHIHLVVADKGVGLRRSLDLNPHYRGLADPEVLEAVILQGASRFTDPGRGGALRRIREVVRANEGRLFVRSGRAGLWQAEVEMDIGEVAAFPGVQVSIQLPRALFFG
ncbi:MAG: STAS domain-containing protein [Candidatus Bipolaricaulaceae bacterium]